MNRFITYTIVCFAIYFTVRCPAAFGQISESVSKSFKLKVENKEELLEKLRRENLVRERLWKQEMENTRKKLSETQKVSENTKIEIKPSVVLQTTDDGSEEMNLKLLFSYSSTVSQYAVRTSVSSNTDDYPAGAYNAMSSNACMLTCNFIKKKSETELARYFVPGQKVTIKITGETDGTAIARKINYNGEYGNFFNKMIYLNGQINNMTVTKESGITDNGQLAFLRTQGVEEFMKTYMDTLQRTDNTYQIYAIENQEKGDQYRRISIEITIHGAFNQQMNELSDAKKNTDAQPQISDVNLDIPVSDKVRSDYFALIIANENYNPLISSVPFALDDGEIFKEYCIKTLGIPQRQIRIVRDATLNGMSDGVDWLSGTMKSWNGKAKALVFYAGHGVPNGQTNAAYLIPSDANPTKPDQLYSLEKLYHTLGAIDCQCLTFFIDACFSGTRRNGEMLVEGTRGVVIKPKTDQLKGNTVVFSAADGYQTAHPFKEKRHGLFTYFLLKSIKDSAAEISYGDLFEQIKDNVSKESSLDSKEQTPTINVSSNLSVDWKNLKF
ncbi:MAG: caspase family protein [Mucinivorans sp.]